MDSKEFEQLVRRKIAGWYTTKEYEDKAVERIVRQRDEIISLLLSTQRDGVSAVLEYLDRSGFYYRASSPFGHHNFPGGLAEHSLGTYKLAAASHPDLPQDSLIIAALLHDICKSDRFWFKGRSIRQHTPKSTMDSLHSVRSIVILKDCGLRLTPSERLAIRWHMKGPNKRLRNPREDADHRRAVRDPLWNAVFYADKTDAKAHPGRKR